MSRGHINGKIHVILYHNIFKETTVSLLYQTSLHRKSTVVVFSYLHYEMAMFIFKFMLIT